MPNPSLLDRIIKEANLPQKGPIGSEDLVRRDPTITPAPATLAARVPAATGYGVTSTRLMDAADAADRVKKMISPGLIPESKAKVPIGSEDMTQRVTPSKADPAVSTGPKFDMVTPQEAPKFDALPTARAGEVVDIAPAVIPPTESGQTQEQVTMTPGASQHPQQKGIDWAKVADIAKSTGKSIIGVLQSAVAGRMAGMEGRAFDPSKDTLLGQENARAQELAAQQAAMKTQAGFNMEAIKAGKAQDLANQQAIMGQQAGITEHLKALDQDFQDRQEQIRQKFAADQTAAEHAFQLSRDERAYQQQMKQAADERDQQMKVLQVQRNTALDLERQRQGMPVGGKGQMDPHNILQYLPGKS